MAEGRRSLGEMIPYLHWICRVEIKTPNNDVPLVHQFGPYAFKEEAVRKAVLLRDRDYADYFETKNEALIQKWSDEGPPFLSSDVDPFPDLDDNRIDITVFDRTADKRMPVTMRRPSNGMEQAPHDDSDDEIESDTQQHTGFESTPRPHIAWTQKEDGEAYRQLDGWMVVVNLAGKDTHFGPYASKVQADRMRRKLSAVVSSDAHMEVKHEAHL